MRAGKSVIIFVNADLDLATYNEFADWLPASLGPPRPWDTPLMVSGSHLDHAIFEVYQPSDFSGEYAPQFISGLTLQPGEQGKIIAQFSDATPFLIERPIALGNALLFNVSATDRKASTLLVNPLFLPLLQQTVLYATAVQSAPHKSLLVGQPLAAGYRQGVAATASVGRAGETKTTPVPIAEDGTLIFGGTDTPGIYQVENRGQQ